MHYTRQLKHGDPMVVKKGGPPRGMGYKDIIGVTEEHTTVSVLVWGLL